MKMIMEHPSFLSSKSEELPENNTWPARPEPLPQPTLTQKKEDPIDKLKSNPVVLGILIGIVIGIILTNMRPVIINPTK